MITNEKYSNELNKVLQFMEGVLSKELPVAIYTIDYFSLAIFNNKDSLIYKRLDNSMTSVALDEIHSGYYNLIRSQALNAIKPNREVKMDNALTNALKQADKEREKTGYSKITTEHVVLALMNNEFKEESRLKKLFEKAGLTYNMLLEKVSVDIDVNDENNDTSLINEIISTKSPVELIEKIKNSPNKSIIVNMDLGDGNSESMIKEMMGLSNPLIDSKIKKGKKNNSPYPIISQYCSDITELAKNNKIENLVGRNDEINTIVRTLGRRKKNNVIILGPEGSGKTTIAEGLAHRINNNQVPQFLQDKKIVSLDMTALIAGTTLRGMFEERVKALLEEIKESKKHILLIDNIGEILSDKGKNDYDIAAMISHALDNGDIQVIGTSDFKSYRNTFDKNPSLGRKFSKIIIDAPTIDESINIMMGNKSYYESFHNVKYEDDAIIACAMLAEKYITDRNLPDSAIDVMDEAGSFISTSRSNIFDDSEIISLQNQLSNIRKEISTFKKQDDYNAVDTLTKTENDLVLKVIERTRAIEEERKRNPILINKDDIYNIVSSKTGIPINKLSVNDKKKIATMADRIKTEIIGQDDAVDTICQSIKRNRVGLHTSKCVFSGVLVGGTGTGKTLIAKKLAKELFGDEKALVRFDMSEYNDKTAVNKLIGSNPGYVGYDEGGQLTEVIKNKKYCVLLLDEIEKADPEIYNIFLQVLDEGFLTDNTGQKIDFKNTIILFTSNVGAKMANDFAKGIGFSDDAENNKKRILSKELKKKFPPEFLNRLDNVIHFNKLTENNLKDIIKLELNKLGEKLKKIEFNFKYDDKTVEYIHNIIKDDKEYGARPIIRAIQDEIENKITDLIIDNDFTKGSTFEVNGLVNCNNMIYENSNLVLDIKNV